MEEFINKLLDLDLIKYEDFNNKINEVNSFIERVNKQSKKKKILIFLSYDETIDPFRTYIPYMDEFEFFLIFTNAIHNNWRNDHANAIISIELNYKILIYILEKSIFDLMLISNINLFWHWRYSLVKMVVKNIPIVCYERDFTSRYHMTDKYILEEFLDNKELAKFIIENENFLFNNADSILCSFDDSRLKDLNNRIKFYLPVKDPIENNFNTYDSGEICLVHGGSISLDSDKTIFNHWGKLQSLFFNISKHATIESFVRFATCTTNKSQEATEWNSYKKIKNFKINKLIPVDEFIKYSSKNYLAGLCLINCSQISKSSNIAYKYMYPTKIFTYLAAGIPVIISKEYEKSSDFILENGLGIAFSNEQIASESFELDAEELLKVKENIRKFDFNLIFKTQLKALNELYKKLILNSRENIS